MNKKKNPFRSLFIDSWELHYSHTKDYCLFWSGLFTDSVCYLPSTVTTFVKSSKLLLIQRVIIRYGSWLDYHLQRPRCYFSHIFIIHNNLCEIIMSPYFRRTRQFLLYCGRHFCYKLELFTRPCVFLLTWRFLNYEVVLRHLHTFRYKAIHHNSLSLYFYPSLLVTTFIVPFLVKTTIHLIITAIKMVFILYRNSIFLYWVLPSN